MTIILTPEFLEPATADVAFVASVDPGATGLGVGRPVDDQVGVLERVLQQAVLLGDAQAVAEAPHVHGAPVPAFPAVRVVLGIGVADEVQEAEEGAVAVAHVAPHVVRPGRGHDPRRTDLPVDADDLLGHQVEGLVPADGLVPGDAAVLDVALALGIEIHPFERREDALRRVDGGAVGHRPGRRRGLAGRGERPAPSIDGPRRSVAVVEIQGQDPQDLAVLDIDEHRSPGGAVGVSLHFSHTDVPPWSSAVCGAVRRV